MAEIDVFDLLNLCYRRCNFYGWKLFILVKWIPILSAYVLIAARSILTRKIGSLFVLWFIAWPLALIGDNLLDFPASIFTIGTAIGLIFLSLLFAYQTYRSSTHWTENTAIRLFYFGFCLSLLSLMFCESQCAWDR